MIKYIRVNNTKELAAEVLKYYSKIDEWWAKDTYNNIISNNYEYYTIVDSGKFIKYMVIK